MHTRHLFALTAAGLLTAAGTLVAPTAATATTASASSAVAAPAAVTTATVPARTSAVTIVASQSARVAKVNKKVTISARVTPAKGAYAKIQVKQKGKWRSVMRSAPVSADGRFQASVWGTGPGTYTIRVYATVGKQVGVSKVMSLRVVR